MATPKYECQVLAGPGDGIERDAEYQCQLKAFKDNPEAPPTALANAGVTPEAWTEYNQFINTRIEYFIFKRTGELYRKFCAPGAFVGAFPCFLTSATLAFFGFRRVFPADEDETPVALMVASHTFLGCFFGAFAAHMRVVISFHDPDGLDAFNEGFNKDLEELNRKYGVDIRVKLTFPGGARINGKSEIPWKLTFSNLVPKQAGVAPDRTEEKEGEP